MKVRITPISLVELRSYLRSEFRGFNTKDYELVVALNLAIFDSYKRGIRNSIGLPIVFKKSQELETKKKKVTTVDILRSYIEEDHPIDFFLVPHNPEGNFEKGGNAFQIKKVISGDSVDLTGKVLDLLNTKIPKKYSKIQASLVLLLEGENKEGSVIRIDLSQIRDEFKPKNYPFDAVVFMISGNKLIIGELYPQFGRDEFTEAQWIDIVKSVVDEE